MKVLYLHGLNSSPKEEKIKILESHFDEVYAPLIDWQNKEKRTKLFSIYANLIVNKNITHVIGSSMGGQMAFYLSLFCNINGLCFNPAFNYLYNDFGFHTSKMKYTHEIFIKLGKKDDVIDYRKTIDFIKKFNNVNYEILDIDHTINTNTFNISVDEFINETHRS